MKKKGLAPPALAAWILSRITRGEDRLSIKSDFSEIYEELAMKEGSFKALKWYWTQVLRSIPMFVINHSCWRVLMFKNYVKIAVRNIKRHKGFTFLNIAGLTIGLTFAVFILVYVRYESSYDRWHSDHENIFRVVQWQPDKESGYISATVQGPLAPTLKQVFPEVVAATRLRILDDILIVRGETPFLENKVCFTSPEIFDVFSIMLLSGDPSTCLTDPTSIVLSATKAMKFFGNKDSIGKELHVGQSGRVFHVTGVFQDIPQNSHFSMDFLIPFRIYADLRQNDLTQWHPNWFCYTYCRLQEGTDAKAFEAKLASIIKKYEEPVDQNMKLRLQPLSRIHLFSNVGHEIGRNNDIKSILIASAIGLAMLIIACINYVNLSTTRSIQRCREIGVRKVVGASRGGLARQFMCESFVITVMAFGLALLLVWFLLPTFCALIGQEIRLEFLTNFPTMAWLLLLFIGTSLISGIYPAFLLSSLDPTTILRHGIAGRARSVFRNMLVVFQFAISTLLILCALVIANQQHYIHSTDMGYTKKHILVLYLKDPAVRRNIPAMKLEFMKHPDIEAVASSNALPNRIVNWDGLNWPEKGDATTFACYYAGVDFDFLHLYGIQIADGRPFSQAFSDQNGAFLMNETAAKRTQWEKPIGRELIHSGKYKGKVVGILRDFHFQSLHNPVAPLYLYLSPNTYGHRYLSVKIRPGGIQGTITFLREQIARFSPKYPFEYHFFDEIFDRAYLAEQKASRIFTVFCFLTILIACLGLYGLVSFTVEKKTKEIGIRKVLGASISSVCFMLSRQYLRWILIANILAWPIGYIAMNAWLQNFAYRINLSVWFFILSSLAAFGIALLAVSYKSIKAATANPVDSLRYE